MVEKAKVSHGGKRAGAGRKAIEVIPYTKTPKAPVISMDDLEALCQLGATHKQIAAYFRITERAIYKLKARNKDVAELMESAMERGNVRILKEVMERMKKSDTLLIFALKNRLGWTDRIRSENEHSGPGGKPIETNTTITDTTALDSLMKQVEQLKIDAGSSQKSPAPASEANPQEPSGE